ncbi:MAG: hypothetical protein QOI78_51 [Actinomycetota bacterium]|nr:hypothetical protein [Actinomycetota bacterium]
MRVLGRDFAPYHAIGRRRSHRHAFCHGRVPTGVHDAVVAAGEATGVHLDKLAELLGFATRPHERDR